ncbi:methyltransferase [Microbacterium sp. NPDC076911]|uniref:DUF7059 domain-containing protein n=1 Tax=Microbacterium sp. NPDC076911 TaxID=3154958 RepID=UPI0034421D93
MLHDPDPLLCQALAADLSAASFTALALKEAWGAPAGDAISRGLRGPAERALGDRDDDLAVLARLFVLGRAQPAASLSRALPSVGADGLVALGLATQHEAAVTPVAALRPQSYADAMGAGEWWIASDLNEAALGGPLPEEHVLGVGRASLTLTALQLPTPAVRGLDVGAGCGIQALRARRNVDNIIATDISERALWFTRLNALINGIDSIETRSGSLFEPVVGETFDRVVSNPPFVITPRSAEVPAYEYRDGGMVGDDLVAAFVAGVGEHLAPGGVAQLLGNWETRDGIDGLDRVREWVQSSAVPLDAWIVERESVEPLAYAELWIRDGGTLPGTARFAALIDAWLDDFASRKVSAVGFGYLLLRRPSSGSPTLTRYEKLHQSLSGDSLGAHLAKALETHDRLSALDTEGLAESFFVVAPDVTEARHHMPGEEDPTVIELRQGGGFGRSVNVDSGLAALVGACDGDLPAGVLIDAIAQLLDVDAAALRADLLPRVRELATMGFLDLNSP